MTHRHGINPAATTAKPNLTNTMNLTYYLRVADTSRRLKLDDPMLRIVVSDPDLCGFEFKRGHGLSRLNRPIILYRRLTGGEWRPFGTGPHDWECVPVICAITQRLNAHDPSRAALHKAIYAATGAQA